MTLDPYAILGLAPGASLAEVKRAYRRMAKAFHPDSAGDAAIPKFLAIHEAYEAIAAGRPMQPQTAASWRRASASWAADPARARATRSNRTSTAAGGSRPGSRQSASGAGSAGPGGPTRGQAGTAEGSTRRRSTRKATLGSTSYDDAVQEPFEPEWEGASWYGRASGTYWTINPKEYADPRKHGPEYQERARRASRAQAGAASDARQAGGAAPANETWSDGWNDADTTFEAETEAAREREREDARRRARFDTGEAVRAHAAAEAASRARMDADARTRPPNQEAPGTGAAIEAWIRALFAAADIRTRLTLAAIGWPPLGVIAATIISNLTGCASFSAACEPPDDLLPLAAGAAIYALLVAIPALARLSAAGTIATLLTAVPVAAFAVRSDLPAGEQVRDAGLALAILLLAWLAGMIGVLVVSRGRILRA